ncbi:MAG TPA: hypothetical protein VN625_00345, partial [Desulfuromonadaceae bacterium]|nr:hypothetical protein [Desulfuromonadaceae bacterium]
EQVANRIIVILLVPYAVAGFFWARQLFFRAQDLQWAGGNVLLPWRRNIRRQSSSLVIGRFRNRYLALIWKEIQLHEASLFIAGALCALQLMLIPLRLLVYEPTLRMAFDNYWSLWLLMPLIIGSTAVADERRGGTLEAQLCLPVPRSTQFSIKFLVGLALSLVLGAAAPSIIEHTRRFGMNDWLPYWIFPAAGGIFFISFYGSTLARTTLQALGMAIGIPVAVGVGIATFVDVASHDYSRGENIRWVGLALLIGMPILPFLLARLMFWNFRWLHQDWKMWRRNAAIILSFFVLLIVGANAIHYRAWEYLTSQDEPHGPARLAPGQSVVVSGMGSTITAILPDGHCWLGSLSYEESFFFDDFATYKGANAHFAGGSNWISIIHGWTGIVGIRSDGSLWHAKMIWPRRTEATVNEFERIGTDRDWSQAAGVGSVFGFLLLKTDGSLWLWGTNSGNSFAVRQRLNDQMPPVRLGDKTNWTQLFTLESHAGAKNKKGERYVWDVRRGDTGDPFQFYPLPKQNFPWQPFNTKAVAVTTNGSLWVALGMEKAYDFIPDKKVQLAPESKWKAASFDYWNQSVIALRQDGTLWKSSSLWSPVDLPEKIAMTQLDHHSDWVSLSPGWLGVAVAADGSVWSWCLPGSLFLAPSRKPIRIGNIFEETPAKH